MVDFTAEWCLTCKTNLKFAINQPEVARAVAAGDVVSLLADWTDPSEEITSALASLGSNSIPVLAIYPANRPAQPIVLRDLIFKQQVLEALEKAGPSKPSGATRITAVGNP
jgi:thiol:disulfide interchange protein